MYRYTSRNPFFIRSVFVPGGGSRIGSGRTVAIPFSSGLCSFGGTGTASPRVGAVAIPFSSGLCSFGKQTGKGRR